MIIKLIKLRMQNFKCYQNKTIEFGEHTSISGRNGIGKSTIADAVNFILFDKLADGTKADKIRPHDENGVDVDFIDIVCELDMEVDGKPINIVKTQKQNWVKPRGQEEKVFKGNENSYIVNTIPKSEKDYKSYMAELIDEQLFQFTSNASAFLKLKTADRRAKLFELVSGMTDADVIATNPKFIPISIELETHKLEEIIGREKKSIKENNEELEHIPARIDAVNRMRSDADVAEMELKKNALNEQISELDKKISDIATDDSIEKLSKAINEKKIAISDYRINANNKLMKQRSEAQAEVSRIESELADAHSKRMKLESEVKNLEATITANTEKINQLAAEYTAIESREFYFPPFDENSTICPTCGRAYEADKVSDLKSDYEARRQKAQEEFNDKQKTDRESINAKGHDLNVTIKADKAILEQKKAEFEEVKRLFVGLNGKKNSATVKLEEIPTEVDLIDNQELAAMETELANLNSQYEAIRNTENPKQALEAQKSELVKELAETQKAIDSADNSKIDEEIEGYKARQKELVQLVANAEKELFLYESFERAKVKLLTDRINEHFKLVNWKMFEPQINGGYKEICEPTYKGTNYGNGLNAGHKILVELDIISTLQKIYNVSVPVFLDNGERLSSDNLPNMDCQLITLKVSDSKELIVESED